MATLRRISAYVLITVFHLNWCVGEAEYDIFPGFESNTTYTTRDYFNFTFTFTFPDETTTTTKPKVVRGTYNKHNNSISNTTATTARNLPFVCPEEEKPSNIGPYEVPTQRDLALHMKRKLLKLFNKYHSKALFFLRDVKEATRSTLDVEKKCAIGNKTLYKKCVRRVSHQCELITKSMVRNLERQRKDVLDVTEDSICNIKAMKIDPVQFIKVLAMEVSSLEFALPGFLRLLSACAYFCESNESNRPRIKPSRHMTDQDLVIKHFLTRKNYVQLIKAPN